MTMTVSARRIIEQIQSVFFFREFALIRISADRERERWWETKATILFDELNLYNDSECVYDYEIATNELSSRIYSVCI